jgi:hypothetical protein
VGIITFILVVATPADLRFWLRFRCAPMLTQPPTLRFGARESLAKTQSLTGGQAQSF